MIWERIAAGSRPPPFSEPEVFDFPEGIGPVECVNVEHEEVLLIPRWVDGPAGDVQVRPRRRVHRRAQDRCTSSASTGPRRSASAGVEVSPRDVVAAVPARPGRRSATGCAARRAPGRGSPAPARTASRGRSTCTTWSTTTGRWREYGSQAVVWQTAINPVVALELLASGTWSGAGVLGPEAFDADAVPRPADGVWVAVGDARGLIEWRPRVRRSGASAPRRVRR